MRQKPSRPRFAAAIVERADNHVLIVLPPTTDGSRKWMFPRGAARTEESAEAAMRRVAYEQLGLTVELVIGQPPIIAVVEGTPVEIRYFFCGIATGDLHLGPYAESRWVSKPHLREYEFEDASKPVVEWLLSA